MPATARFSIGGVVYEVPPLTIHALKQCWPSVGRISQPAGDALDIMLPMLEVVAAGLSLKSPEVTIDILERQATLGDMQGLGVSMMELFRISGMGRADSEGELTAASRSTATSTALSPSSSPTVSRVDPGTESSRLSPLAA